MNQSEIHIYRRKRKITVIILASIALLAIAMGFLFYIFFGATPRLKAEDINAKDISLSWKAVESAELYNIYRMDGSNGKYKKICTVKESKYTDSNLKPQNTYSYKVSVTKSGEEGELSSPVSKTTKSLPDTPSEVSVESVTFDSTMLKWNTVKDADGYCIYRADGDKNEYNKVGEGIDNTFNDSKLISTTKYKYKITAIDKNGESEDSSIKETITKEKVNDRGNYGNNLVNGGLTAEQGDWIYFADSSSYNSIYKMRKDGTSTTKLHDGYCSSINVIGDWIYFSNDNRLCKIKTNGTEYTKISDENISTFSIIGDSIYFANDGLIKMKIDGSEKVKLCSDNISSFNIKGEWIYYSNTTDKNRLYKIKSDGSNRVRLTEDTCGDINVSGEWIYYKNLSDNNTIYKIKTDGTEMKKVLNYQVNTFNVVGDSIVYESWGNGGRLFKVGIDGENNVQLTDSHYNSINIVGNYIFCYDFDNHNLTRLELENVDTNKTRSSDI